MKVGLVLGDQSKEIFAKTISRFFDIYVYRLPEDIPDVLDDEFEFPEKLFEVEVLISYAHRGDLNADLVKIAEEKGVKLVLIAGNFGFLRRKGKTRVVVEDVCCSTYVRGCEFFERFGIPEFEVEIDSGRIADVEVRRSSLCGASYFVAENLRDVRVEYAPVKAGFLVQIYPCLASRGFRGGIHKAANIHKLAIERAIRRAERRRV